MKNTQEPITVYIRSAFGPTKVEGFLIAFGTDKYAQYNKSPFVHFTPKGKRKPTGVRATSDPYLLVLKGHGYPSPADPMDPIASSSPGITAKQSRFTSFDDRYQEDFDKLIAPFVSGPGIECPNPKLLIDIRNTKGTNFIAEHPLRKYEAVKKEEAIHEHQPDF